MYFVYATPLPLSKKSTLRTVCVLERFWHTIWKHVTIILRRYKTYSSNNLNSRDMQLCDIPVADVEELRLQGVMELSFYSVVLVV